ncbi:pathogenicity island protein [Bacillus cereus Rock3-44]|nr:pathogenicity island protein [Bacillus cereus Rock3-44]
MQRGDERAGFPGSPPGGEPAAAACSGCERPAGRGGSGRGRAGR